MCRSVFSLLLTATLMSSFMTTSTDAANRPDRLSVTRKETSLQSEGRPVQEFTLTNSHGLRATIISHGGIVTSLEVPDRKGNFESVVLKHTTPEGFLVNGPYFNCITGRFANRIAKGKFSIDGTEYTLATNNGPNHLHGGDKGLNQRHWSAASVEEKDRVGVQLTYLSPDGEEGYPGNLKSVVTYWLTEKNEFTIEYSATTDKATVINLTNHNYWNLAGNGNTKSTILDHELTLACDKYLPADADLIPTGKLAAVADTPMDFRSAHKIGERIAQVEGGYDHCFAINNGGKGLQLAATVHDPSSGRVMTIHTTEPGIQFYTGNFLDETDACGNYVKNGGFCLEAEEFPDSPNQKQFPSSVLRPGERYSQTTVHTFSVK